MPENPKLATAALYISILAIGLTILSGLAIVYLRGLELLIPGLVGVVIIVFYTRVLNRYPVLCLLSPGLSFGILMVGGTYFALTGTYSIEILLVSLIPFFLVNNLLLLNQFPDVDADREAGRNHALIQYGKQTGSFIYMLFLLLAALALAFSAYLGVLPLFTLAGLLLIAVGIPIYQASVKRDSSIETLLPYAG